ncbi:MAG: hypothetical protein P8P20_13800 [Acidimicrobiales bacterium]|nr:hypothetical protein [Acidimicrobiales bacterium]
MRTTIKHVADNQAHLTAKRDRIAGAVAAVHARVDPTPAFVDISSLPWP